jgi:hypothetical protein
MRPRSRPGRAARRADAATSRRHVEVARTTARTHLDNIFVKTGVTRQADLMRVAMQIAAIVRP